MLLPILNGSGDVAQVFAPEFLAQLPEAQVRAVATQLSDQLGKATGIAALVPAGAAGNAARVTYAFERGTAEMGLQISPAGRIVGLRVTNVMSAAAAALKTLDAVAAAIRQLPGRAGLAVVDPDHAGALIAGTEADRPLAIGSTFKLVVLAELVRAVDAGERRWDEAVAIGSVELPAGGFNQLPAGTTVPLRALAEAMIRVSDNSATDVIARLLGRERIEAMQARVGIRDVTANTPWLGTMELFKLKGDGGALGRRYLGQDVAGRRQLLAGEVAAMPGSRIGPLFADGKPVMIDRLEWFASPADLARVMTWLRDHGTSMGGREALRILALNPGPAAALAGRIGYAGYKGGSEPGVIGMTLLLRDAGGHWRVVSAGWNDPAAAVDELRFGALVQRAAELAVAPQGAK